MEKSPTYWESLISLGPEQLSEAFNRCAQMDLVWAVEQARIVTIEASANSAQVDVARTFCGEAAKTFISTDPKEAVSALEVVANTDSVERAMQLREILEVLAEGNLEAALGCALLLRARLEKDTEAYSVLTDFLIMKDGREESLETGGILITLIRQNNGFLPAQMDKIIDRLAHYVQNNPTRSFDIVRELSAFGDQITAEQSKRLSFLDESIKDQQACEILAVTCRGTTAISLDRRIGDNYVHRAPRGIQ